MFLTACFSIKVADLTSKKCNLGEIDFQAVQIKVTKTLQAKEKRGGYKVYSPEERSKIGRYASENGTAAASKKFENNESTIRGFRSKYEKELNKARAEKRAHSQKIIAHARGRPLMLGSIDGSVQDCLKVIIILLKVILTKLKIDLQYSNIYRC